MEPLFQRKHGLIKRLGLPLQFETVNYCNERSLLLEANFHVNPDNIDFLSKYQSPFVSKVFS